MAQSFCQGSCRACQACGKQGQGRGEAGTRLSPAGHSSVGFSPQPGHSWASQDSAQPSRDAIPTPSCSNSDSQAQSFNWGQWDAPLARDSLCDFKASRKQLIAGKAIRDRDLRVVRAKGCSQTSCLKIWEWLFGGDLLVQPPRVMSPAATRKRQPGMSHGDEQTHHKYTSGSSLKIWKT